MRNPTLCLLAAALAAPCLPQAALADGQAIIHNLSHPAGTGRFVLPARGVAPVPLVIVLPDSLGDEGRSEAYVQALEARGIATLVLGLDGDPELPQPPADPAASAEAVSVARVWALQAAPVLHGGAIGLLGLGAGGRAALAAAKTSPVVALYPGCTGLALPALSPVLVVHGLAAPGAAACATLAKPADATIHGVPGLGHAWDSRPGAWGQGDILPDPAGNGRLAAMPDSEGTALAAELVAGWLALQFDARRELVR